MPKARYIAGKNKKGAKSLSSSTSSYSNGKNNNYSPTASSAPSRGKLKSGVFFTAFLALTACLANLWGEKKSLNRSISELIGSLNLGSLIMTDDNRELEGLDEAICIYQDEVDEGKVDASRYKIISDAVEGPGIEARSVHGPSAPGTSAHTLNQYNGGNIACRVLIANHPDYHYELLESVLLKYPLPWDEMDSCDFSKSNIVVFDLAMTLNPETAVELADYKAYYYSYLQGVPRRRMIAESKRNSTDSDASKYENVMAVFGDIGSPWEMEKYEGVYAAQIAVSCGTIDGKEFVNRSPHHYCVQHVACEINENMCDDNSRARSCWLNPMHNKTCYFMADVFPMYPDSLCDQHQQQQLASSDNKPPKIRLCTVGAAKQHAMLADVFGADANYYRERVELYIHHRYGMLPEYVMHKVDDFVKIANQSSYVGFQQSISQCHILLPLLIAEGSNSGYFHFNAKSLKLSGSMSQVVGYHLPSVLHKDLYDAYKGVLHAPATTHGSDAKSLGKALKEMIEMVGKTLLPEELEQACAKPKIVRGKKCTGSTQRSGSSSSSRPKPKLAAPQQQVAEEEEAPVKEEEAAAAPEEQEESDLPAWLSQDTLLRPQEERQYQWEKKKRAESSNSNNNDMVRREFREQLLASANSPANKALQFQAGKVLREAREKFTQPGYVAEVDQQKDPVFEEILVAVELDKSLMEPGDGIGQGGKALVGESLYKKLDGNCAIYGAGIAYETGFEVQMAKRFAGCAVHAFDCTMTNQEQLTLYIDRQRDVTNLAFHPWCVGEEEKVTDNQLRNSQVYDYGKFASSMVRLEEIKKRLHHDEVDLLKFDIEGFEWKLFDSILSHSKEHLPRQMAFELHTRHANPGYVPPHLTAEKGREAVVELFDRLYKLGYRTVSKELNFGDYRCAEFVVYRFYDGEDNLG